ncbi:hypothetical protein [Novipirellula caenicola]|uniref:CDP-Glycerol:Poly(Glycerophosphate) glycerophosphotransferase n=1 Tax=Novipirellula caenicola TaxID=1536901 RepID=A0ABP9VW96_9BACT
MATGTIFYVGTESEVAHHARPLQQRMPIRITPPDVVTNEARPGDLAIFFSEHFDRFRSAIHDLKRRNVATLYAIDGILEWRNAWQNRETEPACPWTMRPVLCHKVACIGASQARTLSTWGNTEKVEVVGIPRLDHLRLEATPADTAPRESRPDQQLRLLVMTAKWPGFTEAQRHQIAQSLIDVKAWADTTAAVGNRPIELIWRLTGGMDRIIGVENSLRDTTGEDLITALQRSDAVITTPSTAQLESMLVGKPTAILDYTNSPLYVDAAWRITCQGQLDHTITQLCDPPAERMHYQHTVLADSLQHDADATDRMMMLIDKMSEHANAMATHQQPLQFPAALLPPLANPTPLLCAESIFPERAAATQNDAGMLSIELADAQREIKLLRATIQQLQLELGQAHEIFDTIRNHPIAGPVVRTREKILKWVSKSKANGTNAT